MRTIILVLFFFSQLLLADDMTIKINGMTCPSCAASVERALKSLPEVEKLSISLPDGQVSITPKPGQEPTQKDIAKAVKKAGFSVLFP